MTTSESGEAAAVTKKKVWPIIMFPFAGAGCVGDLVALRDSLEAWRTGRGGKDWEFVKPIVIVNNQTEFRNIPPRGRPDSVKAKAYRTALSELEQTCRIKHVWSIDTCSMWQSGLGWAFEEATKTESFDDIFWLIPGDFGYSSPQGKKALEKLVDIPTEIANGHCEICLGEIEVLPNSSKQLIDTYGTYGLLYNWFPSEAQGLRIITEKPRSEFFAVSYQTLAGALIDTRWYAYEQTLMILLQNMRGRNPVRIVGKVKLGEITDEEMTRSTLASAMTQVERMERALKLYWRDHAISHDRENWRDEFKDLDSQSESIRTAAMVILRRLLS